MGTPASLLDLIARGGSMEVGRGNRLRDSEMAANAARIRQAEAATRNADAETEKAMIEADAMRQAQADQQVFSEAFKHSANPKHIDAYIRANASGSGINAWQKASDEHQKSLLEMDEKRRKGEADKAEQIGSIVSSVMTLPPEKRAAAWAQQVIPAIQQVDPAVKISPDYDEGSIPVMLGKLRYTKAAAEQADAIAKAKKQEVDIANARQEGVRKSTEAFMQAVSADPTQEGLNQALELYPEMKGKVPSYPGAWMTRGGMMTVPVKDRAKAEMDARTLKGTDEFGVPKLDRDKLALETAAKQEMARHNRQMEGLQASASRIAQANSGVQREGMLRDDFAKESKKFVSVRDAYGKIQQAVQEPSAAADISVIFGFMRMQDPDSTVREGEQATAANAGGIPERVRAMYNRALNGERLAPEMRADFARQANRMYSQAEKDHSKIETFYSDTAKRYGMDPKQVLPDYRTTFEAPKPAGSGKFVVTDPAGGKHAFETQAQADAFKKAAGIR
jgi:hypothetical protein